MSALEKTLQIRPDEHVSFATRTGRQQAETAPSDIALTLAVGAIVLLIAIAALLVGVMLVHEAGRGAWSGMIGLSAIVWTSAIIVAEQGRLSIAALWWTSWLTGVLLMASPF